MTRHVWVRFPDGTVRHAKYDTITDTTSRFLCDDVDEAHHLGWCMDCDYDPAWDGQGIPVILATDYDDTHWPGTAYAEKCPSGADWWWLTSGTAPGDDVISDGRPEWARWS